MDSKYLYCPECDMTVRHTLNDEGKYVCQNCGHISDSHVTDDPNLLVFSLEDVRKNMKDVMKNVYDVPEDTEISDDVLRSIWYEVHTESVVSTMNEMIYDACIDYVRENLIGGEEP